MTFSRTPNTAREAVFVFCPKWTASPGASARRVPSGKAGPRRRSRTGPLLSPGWARCHLGDGRHPDRPPAEAGQARDPGSSAVGMTRGLVRGVIWHRTGPVRSSPAGHEVAPAGSAQVWLWGRAAVGCSPSPARLVGFRPGVATAVPHWLASGSDISLWLGAMGYGVASGRPGCRRRCPRRPPKRSPAEGGWSLGRRRSRLTTGPRRGVRVGRGSWARQNSEFAGRPTGLLRGDGTCRKCVQRGGAVLVLWMAPGPEVV